MSSVPVFPQAASTVSGEIDSIYIVWTALSVLIAVAIAVLVAYYSVKYHKDKQVDRTVVHDAAHERLLRRIEIAWMVVPMVIFLAMFFWSAESFYRSATVPGNALPVYVVGKQWMWHLEHAGGQREINELHVPLGRPVELVMTSQDVIHSFSIPGFRVKQDVLPGRYTTIWFEATQSGDFRWFCTQYCGAAHSRMIGRVVVMESGEFDRWLEANAGSGTMASRGAVKFRQFGCSGCHGAHATVHAPPLQGLFGSQVRLQDGRTVVADERFVRDAVLLPNKDVPAGYEASMPSFRGQIDEEQLLEIIAYVKSIAAAPQGEMQ